MADVKLDGAFWCVRVTTAADQAGFPAQVVEALRDRGDRGGVWRLTRRGPGREESRGVRMGR